MNPYQQALIIYQSGDIPRAAQLLQQIVKVQPDYAPAWHLMGIIAQRQGNLEKAAEFLNRAGQLEPKNPEIQSHRAEVLRRLSDLDSALKFARRAVRLQPKNAAAQNNYGLILQDLERVTEAEAVFRTALKIDQKYHRAYYNLATILHAREEYKAAENLLRDVLQLNPNYGMAHMVMGMVLAGQYEFSEAARHFEIAIRLRPEDPKVYLNYGNALLREKRFDTSIRAFRQALAYQPDYPEALFGMASVLDQEKKHGQAVELYQQAIMVRPDWPEAYHKLGAAYNEMEQYPEAKTAYLKALDLKPDFPAAISSLLRVLSATCDWVDLDMYYRKIKNYAREALAEDKNPPISSSQANAYDFSNEERMVFAACNSREIEERLRATHPGNKFSYPARDSDPARLRIGYLSYDFRNHATSHLMRTVFGLHDRSRFEIYTYSYGPDDGSEYRKKIEADSDHFIDFKDLDEFESARRINTDGIHILVDLMGYVANCRPEIAMLRPAPVQVNYLGFPGTMGSKLWDYIITDEITTPKKYAKYLTEAAAYMPNTYQCNDHRQPFDQIPVTRADEGLPDNGFVFASFNTLYKIEPTHFEVWMNILKQVPNSVLWLLVKYDYVKENLRREASARGVDPDRLVFAKGKHKPRHLARFRLADLFLDTRFYNAHTTASDSLWAGVPLITCPGETFSSRVAASILTAAGLPELIMVDLEGYEREAVRLGKDPALHARLKSKLAQNIKTYPLFDTPRWVKNVERIYEAIWEKYASGEPPSLIEVEDVGPSGVEISPEEKIWS